ncbi:MAG TPA: GDSL-type esterase/lipase family protein [Burkholderiales bacterium]|nr:GDSL-type esterase/lipase family protein [Burkholderiales bacterium]
MTPIIRIFVLLVCCVGMLASCSRTPRLSPLASDAVILAFGDSLTYGTGATAEESYPAILENLINRKVVRAGVPGELSSEGLARLPEALETLRPQLLILCHGGNDLLRRTGEAAAEANIRAMIQLAKERGVGVVLIAVPRPGLRLSPPDYYESLAQAVHAPVEADVLSTILGDNSLKADMAHPNAQGYRKLAEAVASLLKKAGAV